jgi:hypothetical protein
METLPASATGSRRPNGSCSELEQLGARFDERVVTVKPLALATN